MTDKNYCMSSYLALKFIEQDEMDFFEGYNHRKYTPIPNDKKVLVSSAHEIEIEIEKQVKPYLDKKVGVFLSGGMDSAIVASFLPGKDAYTFRYVGIDYPNDELLRAEQFAQYYNLHLHYVDITWDSMIERIDMLMDSKKSPVYYIEPQLYQAAKQAKQDGIETIMVGEASDMVFGGLGWLLAKDWSSEEFAKMYISLQPERVLCNPVSLRPVFDRFGVEKLDVIEFINDIFWREAYSAYENAFSVADMPYYDPFERLKMAEQLDFNRVRNGEPKYLVRELFSLRYPELPIPSKIRLPNPLDSFMKNWSGPKREEFLQNIDINTFSGKHKWQLFCLERFLNNNT